MKTFGGFIAVCLMVVTVCTGDSVLALSSQSLKIQPLSYRESLKQAEKKKAYVDIANPNDHAITIDLSVKAFEQIDNEGSLRFYDDERLAAGIHLDLDSAELQPKDVLRLYFVVDGEKLPTGDVFAAIFASTRPAEGSETSVAMSSQVGTLLFLTNGTPPSRSAVIESIETIPVQIGESIDGVIAVRNTAPAGRATGFFPMITVQPAPYEAKEVTGPLLFAGRTRQIHYRQPGDYFGLVNLRVASGSSEQSRWIFVMTGYWRWAAPGLLLLASALIVLLVRRKHSRRTMRQNAG